MGGKLRVALNRIDKDHPSIPRVRIDLLAKRESNHLLPIPITVAHIYADILQNLGKEKDIRLGVAQTISEIAFNNPRELGRDIVLVCFYVEFNQLTIFC